MLLLSNRYNYVAHLIPKTADGGPARVDGKPLWSRSGDNGAFGLVVDDDGFRALITTPDDDGVRTAMLRITADADLGEGVKELVIEQVLVSGPPAAADLGFALEPIAKTTEDETAAEEDAAAPAMPADNAADGSSDEGPSDEVTD